MKLCEHHCIPACDFCVHYDFNGDENGVYTGDGYCNLHNINADPGYYCDDFHCFRANDE